MKSEMKRYFPILIILSLMIVAYLLGATEYLSFENLKSHHEMLKTYVLRHPFLSAFFYIIIHCVAIALSLPAYFFLTLLGGFLFPQPWSTFYVIIAATSGSLLLFLTLRLATEDILKKKAGHWLLKMEKGFQKNAVSYLLFLHFSHLFPFWLINLAAAIFAIPLFTFIWTTVVGIIPSSFIFTQIGAGLGAAFATDEPISLSTIFNLKIKIALLCIGILPLIILLFKRRAYRTA
jgi:uncharacterized membrane protein YdjX (TVP38/TMEM64 family)